MVRSPNFFVILGHRAENPVNVQTGFWILGTVPEDDELGDITPQPP